MLYFIHDDRGTLEIPLRLVVYVIMTAAIIAVAAFGLSHLKPAMTENIMEKQVAEIRASLNVMQYGAARNLLEPASHPGNMRTLKITIPEDVMYLAFGVDPDPDNDGDLTNTREDSVTEKGNVIFYMSGAGKRRIPLEDTIELREGLLENGRWMVNSANGKQYGFVITGEGKFEITFELVYDPVSKEKYTLVHSTDDLNAFINPYDIKVLPNTVWVSVDPKSIPSDGVTGADIIIQLRDKKGIPASKDGVEINLTASLGNLSSANLTTVKGIAAANITSDMAGTAVISASSPGLNHGSAYLTITQVPVILEFNMWLNDSEPQSRRFNTSQELRYGVYLRGSGTEFFGWPIARIEVNGTEMGEETIDSAYVMTKRYPSITLPAGTHILSIGMTNDFSIPWIGDRNMYVEDVVLSV